MGTMGGKSVWYWTTTPGSHKRHMAGGAPVQGHVDDPVDLLGSGHGAERGRVPSGASGLLGFARLRFLAAERVGLAMLFAAGLVQALTEFEVLLLHLGQATNQALVLALEGLMLLVQGSQAAAQV